MAQLSARRIRLFCDARDVTQMRDEFTSATPRIFNSNAVRFEIAIADADAVVTDIDNIQSLTLAINQLANRKTSVLAPVTVAAWDLDGTLTQETWADGTKQHAVIEFTDEEFSFDLGTAVEKDFWLVVYVTTTEGHVYTIGTANVRIVEDGAPPEGTAEAPASNYYSKGESDARYVQGEAEVESGPVAVWKKTGSGAFPVLELEATNPDFVGMVLRILKAGTQVAGFDGNGTVLGDGSELTWDSVTKLVEALGTNAAAVRSAISAQAFDSDLAAIAALTSAANKLPYYTGLGTAALADFTVLARTLAACTTEVAMRNALGASAGVWPVGVGGTGAATASAARANLGIVHIVKAADTDRANTTTLANDPDLQLNVSSGETWSIEIRAPIAQLGGLGGGMKAALQMPATSSHQFQLETHNSGSGWGLADGLAIGQPFTIVYPGNVSYFIHYHIYAVFSASGTVVVQWAQETSSADVSRVRKGAYVRAVKLN